MKSNDSQYPICRHIKTNGRRCQSPALRGTALCYFHRNLHSTHRRPVKAESLLSYWQESTLEGREGLDPLIVARAYPHQNEIFFPRLEDAESVQLATSMLFQAIATGQIHFKRARMLLYTLKIACINQRALTLAKADSVSSPMPTRIVRTAYGHVLAAPAEDAAANIIAAPPSPSTEPHEPAPPNLPPTPAELVLRLLKARVQSLQNAETFPTPTTCVEAPTTIETTRPPEGAAANEAPTLVEEPDSLEKAAIIQAPGLVESRLIGGSVGFQPHELGLQNPRALAPGLVFKAPQQTLSAASFSPRDMPSSISQFAPTP